MFASNRIVSLAQLHALPTIYPVSDTERTGLITYEIVLDDIFRQAGVYAGRILKGAKPAELPVQLPSRFRLIINFKTAKALGLEVPLSLSGSIGMVVLAALTAGVAGPPSATRTAGWLETKSVASVGSWSYWFVERTSSTTLCPIVLNGIAPDAEYELGFVPNIGRPGGNITGLRACVEPRRLA